MNSPEAAATPQLSYAEKQKLETLQMLQETQPRPLTGRVEIPVNQRAAKLFNTMVSIVLDPKESWQEEALCKGMGPEYFYPENNRDYKERLEFCEPCPKKEECLEYALSNNIEFGIWGGKSENERRKIKRHRKILKSPSITRSI